jgi:hypothetical protein
MKSITLIASVFLACFSDSSALTESDLTEAAITGKTLTFTIEKGNAPFATTGSWTAKFGAAPGKALAITRVSGDTVNATGTWSYNSSLSGFYEYTLKPIVAGQADGILTIWISDGGLGRYEIYINNLFGVGQTGGFTIGSDVAKNPDITVLEAGSTLADGKKSSKRNFGSVKVGKSGSTKVFTIKNDGNANLTNIAIEKDGAAKGDFKVSKPTKTTLTPGETAQFKVKFSPTVKGKRQAALRIKSNDRDENPFDIAITGQGAK